MAIVTGTRRWPIYCFRSTGTLVYPSFRFSKISFWAEKLVEGYPVAYQQHSPSLVYTGAHCFTGIGTFLSRGPRRVQNIIWGSMSRTPLEAFAFGTCFENRSPFILALRLFTDLQKGSFCFALIWWIVSFSLTLFLQVSVLNLFEMSKRYHQAGIPWFANDQARPHTIANPEQSQTVPPPPTACDVWSPPPYPGRARTR